MHYNSIKNIDEILLSPNSKHKYNTLAFPPKKEKNVLNFRLKSLLEKVQSAFVTDLNVYAIDSINLKTLQFIFLDFDNTINNVTKSKFQNDVMKMNKVYSICLKIINDNIKVNFLMKNNHNNLIAVIIHSLNTFCHLFPYNYNGLNINVCLDDNSRNIEQDIHNNSMSYNEIFKIHKTRSSAFNVSGVTYPQ